mmetsp:Transcript_19440/g.45190  ORF Transcript_19440/g.45190 Transcript_19440/m.45190 type:complete len:456 (-) Transcript_19440:187-1554(-)
MSAAPIDCPSGLDFPTKSVLKEALESKVEHCSDTELAVLQEINALQSEMDATKREILEKEATLLRWQGSVPGMEHIDRIRPGRLARPAPLSNEDSFLGAIIEDAIEELEATMELTEAKVRAPEQEKEKAKPEESQEDDKPSAAEEKLLEEEKKPLEEALAMSLKEKVQDAIDKVRSHLAQFNKETAEMTTMSSPAFSTMSGASKTTDSGMSTSSTPSVGGHPLTSGRSASVRVSSAAPAIHPTCLYTTVHCDGQDVAALARVHPAKVIQILSGPAVAVRRLSVSPVPAQHMRQGSCRRSLSRREMREVPCQLREEGLRQTPAAPTRQHFAHSPLPASRMVRTAPSVPTVGRRRSAQLRSSAPLVQNGGLSQAHPQRVHVSMEADSSIMRQHHGVPVVSIQALPGPQHPPQRASTTPGPSFRRITSPRLMEHHEQSDHRAAVSMNPVSCAGAPIIA